MLERVIFDRLKDCYEQLLEQGCLPTRDALERYIAMFRMRFGPEKLAQLDGEVLLNTMHAHGQRDSLVYWLEFKNDEEFPDLFGSIAGGNALKFGIYRRRETGAWMMDRGDGPVAIDLPEAIDAARTHRDQLLAGATILDGLPSDSSDENYGTLQESMERVAPDVSDTAWAHKYFSLLHSQKIDDFHVEDYQRFYIRKMLQVPPALSGRYRAAGRYVAVATQLQIPLNHLSALLKSLGGRPYRVWRIGTRLGGTRSIWPLMRDHGCAAIGWGSVGELSGLVNKTYGKDRIRQQLEASGEVPTTAGRNVNQIATFATRISEDDLLLAADGEEILGIGRVTGPYQYKLADSEEAPHQRPVDWLDIRSWKLPEAEGLQSTVREVKKFPINLVEIERRLLDAHAVRPRSAATITPKAWVLEGIPGQLQAILDRKGQAILYGPPGTGKTYWASWTARQLAAHAAFGEDFESLSSVQRSEVINAASAKSLVRSCTFHPAYGYEDFIEGFRPKTGSSEQLQFELRDGIFKRLCDDAKQSPAKKFYLLVDEINRGDIPRIFGELITLLELDKRGTPAYLPVSAQSFTVPPNVFVIGTMNTADRSIALLDAALRRRFGFIELMPDSTALGDAVVANSIPLGLWLSALNQRIRSRVSRDARNLQIGHAYLLEGGRPVTDFARFVRILAEDIVPLLEEYCYENYSLLGDIIGSGLVDANKQCIRSELFAPAQRDELLRALLEPSPDIATSIAAALVERVEAESDLDDAPDETP